MTEQECSEFIALPFAKDAISLRRWDESGKNADIKMPAKEVAIAELLRLAEECR
jgi:predicted HD phosphohydrolase